MTNSTLSNLQNLEHLPDPKTKAELLERMAIAYEAADSLINAHDEAALTTPLYDSGWSAKDFLAHLVTWEQGMVALLEKKDRFREMGIDAKKIDLTNHDAVNEALYRQHAGRPFADVLTAFHTTHQELLNILTDLDDEDLQKPYRHYQPQATASYTTKPIMGWLAGNTYAHYAEHLVEIGRLLNRVQNGPMEK